MAWMSDLSPAYSRSMFCELLYRVAVAWYQPALASADQPMPGWASTLGLVLDAARRENFGPGPETIRDRAHERPLPFEETFRPFLAVAQDGLEDAAGPALADCGGTVVVNDLR